MIDALLIRRTADRLSDIVKQGCQSQSLVLLDTGQCIQDMLPYIPAMMRIVLGVSMQASNSGRITAVIPVSQTCRKTSG